jgi:transcription termination/antitermination protein NusG
MDQVPDHLRAGDDAPEEGSVAASPADAGPAEVLAATQAEQVDAPAMDDAQPQDQPEPAEEPGPAEEPEPASEQAPEVSTPEPATSEDEAPQETPVSEEEAAPPVEAPAVDDAGAAEAESPAEEAATEEAPAEEAATESPQEEAATEEAPQEAAEPRAEEAAADETAPAGSGDPFRSPGDWYVVHTYAGYENKVRANLLSRIHSMQMEDKIFDVHIPMEDVMEIKGGKKQVVQRKVFPGYLLVKMFYDNDSWYVVRNTPGVTGFVSSGTGTKPTPLSRREVEKILAVKQEEVKPTFRLEFEEGDTVRIISGPFADFNGSISEINVDQSKLKVLVNIFDRETPVELGFDQVAKV